MTVYLGIDPGTTRIGYGIIEVLGSNFKPLIWGVLSPQSNASPTQAQQEIRAALAKVIVTWKPAGAAVERLFFMKNQKSAMAVSEMRGVIMLTLADHNIPTHEFTPLEVKQRVCGSGKADKSQITRMVRLVLRIRERIAIDDAADALAIAMCAAAAPISR